MPTSPLLSSIQVAKPASYGSENAIDPHERPWTTGFFKIPVDVPVFAREPGMDGA